MKAILEKVIKKNIHWQNSRNVSEVLSTMHSEAMGYVETEKMLKAFFNRYLLKQTVVLSEFLFQDSEYSYMKVKCESRKIEGPEYSANINESLIVFKQQNESWKIWTQVVLKITPLHNHL